MKKKSLSMILVIMVGLVFSFGCEFLNIGEDNKFTSVINRDTTPVFTEYNVHKLPDSQMYEIADSFALADGNYYYLYYVGIVEAVPISTEDCEGVYYSGSNVTVTLNKRTSEKTTSFREVSNMTSSMVSSNVTASVGSSLTAGYKGVLEQKIEASISNSLTTSLTQTRTETISTAIEREKEFSQEVEFSFRAGEDKVGYYCYATVASMKLYQVVTYNPQQDKIVAVVPYSVLGMAVQGILYSPTSFFIYDNQNPIEFDVERIMFPKPESQFTTPTSIPFDPNKGTCDAYSKEYLLGESFGDLPKPQKIGYTFDAWYQNGVRIAAETPVVSFDKLVAQYKLKTDFSYTCSEIRSQNGFGTSAEMDSAKLTANLGQSADIAALKQGRYKARFIISFDAEPLTISIWKIKYKVTTRFGSQTVYTYDDKIESAQRRTITSNEIDSSKFEGTFDIILSTENIQGIKLKNITVKLIFFQ